jgi:biopolymer transport protein ExbB
MRLSDRLLSFTLLGSEWVLWLLVVLSVLSVGVMVERGLSLSARAPDFDELTKKLLGLLGKGDWEGAREAIGAPRSPEARVGLVGLAELARGRDAASEAMASAKARERLGLEKNLGILGTLGSNAPFIGLFGTVLGIIKAFADLARSQGGSNAQVVMSGISEALVATAVGLLVAIPAVVAFNVFQGRVRRSMGRIDAMAHLILAATPQGGGDEAGRR